MRRLSVIAERLTMVARQHDRFRARQTAQLTDERRQRTIDSRDFAGVGTRRIVPIEGRRRCVRRMRIEDVNPGEPLMVALRGNPS